VGVLKEWGLTEWPLDDFLLELLPHIVTKTSVLGLKKQCNLLLYHLWCPW